MLVSRSQTPFRRVLRGRGECGCGQGECGCGQGECGQGECGCGQGECGCGQVGVPLDPPWQLLASSPDSRESGCVRFPYDIFSLP